MNKRNKEFRCCVDLLTEDLVKAKELLVEKFDHLKDVSLESASRVEFFYYGYEVANEWLEGSYDGDLHFNIGGNNEVLAVNIARQQGKLVWIRPQLH